MPRRRWIEAIFVVCFALVMARSWASQIRPPSHHNFGFWSCFVLLLCAWGLSYLPNRRFLLLKACFAIIFALTFRYLNIGFARSDVVSTFFMLGVVFAITVFRPYEESWRRYRQPWWLATKRTILRLRGKWPDDEAEFVAKTLGPRT